MSLFRLAFRLEQVPKSFRVRVTADNRFELFANGQRVGLGPARGDLTHWRYETIDLAPHLKPGKNVLAAMTWFLERDEAPMAQMGLSNLAFSSAAIPNDTEAKLVNTPWRVAESRLLGHAFLPLNPAEMGYAYCVVGPGDRIHGDTYPWGWEQPDFDDSGWEKPVVVADGSPRGARDAHSDWMLVPDVLPPMEATPEPVTAVVRSEGITVENHRFGPDLPVTIPPQSKAALLLDRGHLTTGYPELAVEGGAGATVRLRYAEALFGGEKHNQKGNRNEIAGKILLGYRDEFLPDGPRRVFRPLWWRTFRYLQIEVETAAEPLVLRGLTNVFSAYPFQEAGRFAASDEALKKIWNVGWRTARLCATRPTWTAPTTSSSSTAATPASSASSRITSAATPGSPATRSPSSTIRGSPTASRRAATRATSSR